MEFFRVFIYTTRSLLPFAFYGFHLPTTTFSFVHAISTLYQDISVKREELGRHKVMAPQLLDSFNQPPTHSAMAEVEQ